MDGADVPIAETDEISPIEVGAGNYPLSSSPDRSRKKYSRRIGTPAILYAKDVMEADGILRLPLDMAMCL